jgi:hypothetical protein
MAFVIQGSNQAFELIRTSLGDGFMLPALVSLIDKLKLYIRVLIGRPTGRPKYYYVL